MLINHIPGEYQSRIIYAAPVWNSINLPVTLSRACVEGFCFCIILLCNMEIFFTKANKKLINQSRPFTIKTVMYYIITYLCVYNFTFSDVNLCMLKLYQTQINVVKHLICSSPGAYSKYIGTVWTKVIAQCYKNAMMTSSNGNIFRVIGHLCGEFIGHRLIPRTRPVTRSFDVFFDLRLNNRLSKQSWG